MLEPPGWSLERVEEAPRRAGDPLAYPGYADALERARERSGADESVVIGRARFGDRDAVLALFRFPFMGGSMGEEAGNRLAHALEVAVRDDLPFVLRTATGGVRLQEGTRALVQMPKIAAARLALAGARLPLVAVLGNPTTGGVLAGLAAAADVVAVETGATVGFTGPRVAERATGRPLGPRSHTAASALAHGLVDAVVDPPEGARFVAHVLEVLAPDEPRPVATPESPPARPRDAWDAVMAARSPGRGRAPEIARQAADSYAELRGDRSGADDHSVVTLVARVAGRRAVVVALDRDHPLGPAGYRKAARALAVAERLGLPVVSLIDTRGADPSEESEAGGVAWAIADLFQRMLSVSVPVLAIVTGEGGSGGALAFAAADVVLAYEDAIFTVISPDLAAEILWRDPTRGPEAARLLRPSAPDLLDQHVVDGLLAEPFDAHSVTAAIAHHLDAMTGPDAGPENRRRRWMTA